MDKRIDEIERSAPRELIVHLKYGFRLNDDGCHTFGADTLKEVSETMKRVKRCRCAECELIERLEA